MLFIGLLIWLGSAYGVARYIAGEMSSRRDEEPGSKEERERRVRVVSITLLVAFVWWLIAVLVNH